MVKKLWTLFIFTLLHFSVGYSVKDFAMSGDRSDIDGYYFITECIVEVCRKELFWKPTAVLKTVKNQSESKNNFTNNVIWKLTAESVPLMIINNFSDGILDPNDANYLVIDYFEDCDALTSFDFDLIVDKVKYFIIIENFDLDICKLHFKGIGNVIGHYAISFFIKATEDIYNLFTFVPEINSESCREFISSPLKINKCGNGKWVKENLFPIKTPTNMNKCPLKVGMGSLYPFAMIEKQESLRTNDHLDINKIKGMDLEMMKIIINYFNATLDLYYIFKREENAFLDMEFIELVFNGTLDICAGGIYRVYGDNVEYSGIYVRQAITWIYYLERHTRSWENLVTTVDGLYLFLIFYFIYSIVWYLICTFDKQAVSLMDTLLHAWGVLVGTASLQDARTFKQKTLNMVYLIMCLHLSVYVSIQLYSFFTIHGPPEMFKNNESLMKSGMMPYLNGTTKYFVNDEKYINFANTSTDCGSFSDCAKQSVINKGTTVLIEAFAYNVQAETAVNDEARVLTPTENLLTVYYEMIIRKGHPLVVKFQRVVKRLFEGGITGKLFTEAIGLTVVEKARTATKNMVANSYSCQVGCKLSLEQIGGVFYIVVFGCAASCVIFILELVISANKTLK